MKCGSPTGVSFLGARVSADSSLWSRLLESELYYFSDLFYFARASSVSLSVATGDLEILRKRFLSIEEPFRARLIN